jgi:hypothetical protein
VRTRDLDTWLSAREAEGWIYIQATPHNRNHWRVTVECRAQ